MRRILLRNHTANFGGARFFDGSTIFFLVCLCPEGQRIRNSSQQGNNANIRITIRKVGSWELGDF